MDQEVLDIILGLARHGLTTLGGGLMAAGYITQDQETAAVTGILGIISTAVGVAWSWWQKRQAAARTKLAVAQAVVDGSKAGYSAGKAAPQVQP